MADLYLNGLQQILHPQKHNKTVGERIYSSLSHSGYGLKKGEPASAMDTFSITEHISELLSPACGMTDEEKERYLARIMAKLKSGKKLTAEEMRFLQAEHPALYQQAARIQVMRNSLETRLKACKSKEEAQRVFSDALSAVSEKDPLKEYIIAAYQDAYEEYQKSDDD